MKTMKKSMFITTILMVVLLVVALSTATFAWYTANSNAAVNDSVVYSAKSESAALAITGNLASLNSADFNNTTVTLTMDNGTKGIVPMIPDQDLTGKSYAAAIASFQTFTISADGSKLASAVTTAAPAVIKTVTDEAITTPATYTTNTIIIGNQGGLALASVDATITLNGGSYIFEEVTTEAGVTDVTGLYTATEGEGTLADTTSSTTAVEGTVYYKRYSANNYLRVAVFAGTTNDDNMTCVGVVGAGNIYYHDYGTAAADAEYTAPSATITAATGNKVTVGTNVGIWGSATDTVYVRLICWFEGTELVNSIAGSAQSFSIAFGSTNANA